MAPGDAVREPWTDGQPSIASGTSVAAPFVTGAIALLWSVFPDASATEVKSAVTRADVRRTTIVPPLLDAWAAYRLVYNRQDSGVTAMAQQKKSSVSKIDQQQERQPYRVRLPGIVKDEDVGLGDVVKRVTYSVGLRPCSGCNQRAAALNRWMVFKR